MALPETGTILPLSCGDALFRTVPRQDVRHSVVAFMARDLEQRVLRALHRNLDRPGTGEHGRVLDASLIQERVCVGSREPLDHAEVLVAQAAEVLHAEAALLVELEVGGLDDERIALPSAAGASGPLLDALR